MLKRWSLISFLVFAVLQIISQIFELPVLNFVSKPLLVICLVAFYSQSVSSINRQFILALIFCWLGDVFLMFDQYNELFFMAGLGSFLLAHVFLILTYRQMISVTDNFE